MSSLMYPKVFSDYFKRQIAKGGEIIRHLPTPVYLYGMTPGHSFTISVPTQTLLDGNTAMTSPEKTKESVLLPAALIPPTDGSSGSGSHYTQVTVSLDRIGPLKNSKRDLVFSVNGSVQVVTLVDNSNTFVFEGPMAVPGNAQQLGR
jgi:hypothetical protein